MQAEIKKLTSSSNGSIIRSPEGSSKDNTQDNSSNTRTVTTMKKEDQASFFNLFVLTTYVLADLKKKPRSYKIGVFTVTLTITFVILLYSILDVLPLVFIKQAQNTVGESDFIFTAVSPQNISQSTDSYMYDNSFQIDRIVPGDSSLPFINYTEFVLQAAGVEEYDGFAPRWFGVAGFLNPDDLTKEASGLLMILDTEIEVKIGLGRDFSKTLLGENQAFMTRSALKFLEVEPNGRDKVQLFVDTRDYLSLFFGTSNPLTREDITTLNTELNLGLDEGGEITVSVADLVNTTAVSGKTY